MPRTEWIHIDDVLEYKVSTVSAYRQKIGLEDEEAVLAGDPDQPHTLWSLVRTAAQPGCSMQDLV